MTTDPALAALVDPHRLMVAGALVDVQRSTDEIMASTGLDRRAVLEAIGGLWQVGLVGRVDDSYTLPSSNLHRLAGRIAPPPTPMDPSIAAGMDDSEREVLARFFEGRALTEIPANRAKRSIVLERVALEFEPGRHYTEAAVDDVLRGFHPDHAALRRHLVDEGLLDREDGRYWRSGGRVPDQPSDAAG